MIPIFTLLGQDFGDAAPAAAEEPRPAGLLANAGRMMARLIPLLVWLRLDG